MIPLNDVELFGKDDAETEDPERLDSYFVDKDVFKSFRNPHVRLSVARCRKGIGKSALLSRTAYAVRNRYPDDLVIQLRGSDLVAQRPAPDLRPDILVYDWQQRVCTAILHRIGADMRLALTDDAMSIVESSELAGFKQRNLLRAIADRIGLKIHLPSGASIAPTRVPAGDASQVLARYRAGQERNVWVFVDDIDATYIDSPAERLRLSTFLSAMRTLAHEVSGLIVRCAIRSDVWTLIQADEALDKVEQYAFDISWDEDEILAILAKRIHTYLRYHADRNESCVPANDIAQQRMYMERVFESNYTWGRFKRPPYVVIDTLSHGRPRWAIQLCRAAGHTAAKGGHELISLQDITDNLKEYGEKRVADLKREHQHQCPQIGELVSAFMKQQAKYETDELLKTIRNRICEHLTPVIEGRGTKEPMDVAHFLFRIGFLTARDELDEEDYRHYTYEELPQLLHNRVNPDYGYCWEIHPCFRQFLQLRNYLPRAPHRRRA